MLEHVINGEGFIQDDVVRVGRLLKALEGSMDDKDREQTTEELRQMCRRSVATIREHRKKHGAPGMSGKGHRMDDEEPKKGKKGARSASPPARASGSNSRPSKSPAPVRGKARRLG